jgi:tripartite-type tricarboxylate transporter receptor subunit TctC
MSRPIVTKLNEAFNRAMTSPAFMERFGQIGDEPGGGPPEEFADTIRTELAKWADVVKRSGAKLE